MPTTITSSNIQKARLERSKPKAIEPDLQLQILKENWQYRIPDILGQLEYHTALGITVQMGKFLEQAHLDCNNSFLAYVIFEEIDENYTQKVLSLKVEEWPEFKAGVSDLCDKYELTLLRAYSYPMKSTIDDIAHCDISFLFEFELNPITSSEL